MFSTRYWQFGLDKVRKFQEVSKYPDSEKMFNVVHQDSGQAYALVLKGYKTFNQVVAKQGDRGTVRPLAQAKVLHGFAGDNDNEDFSFAFFPESSSRVAQPSKKLPSLAAQIARL